MFATSRRIQLRNKLLVVLDYLKIFREVVTDFDGIVRRW